MRGRVPIGIDEFGMPIMKQIRAKSEYEFMIKAGQMMLAAGLLGDYVLRGEETSVVKPVEKIPFKAVAERWYKVYKEDNETLKPSTKADYRRMLDKVIYPVLGDKGIDEITTTQLQEMLNEHRDMASTSQTKLLITLRQVFDAAHHCQSCKRKTDEDGRCQERWAFADEGRMAACSGMSAGYAGAGSTVYVSDDVRRVATR